MTITQTEKEVIIDGKDALIITKEQYPIICVNDETKTKFNVVISNFTIQQCTKKIKTLIVCIKYIFNL